MIVKISNKIKESTLELLHNFTEFLQFFLPLSLISCPSNKKQATPVVLSAVKCSIY